MTGVQRLVAILSAMNLDCRMKLRSWMIPAIGWAAFTALLTVADLPDGAPALAQPAGYTKDRLTSERMRELAAEPMAFARRGDIDAAIASFAGIKARTVADKGKASLEVADLLTAFGVELYIYGLDSKEDRYRLASLPYLREAIDAYKAALGPRHPEVAVAQDSYTDAV